MKHYRHAEWQKFRDEVIRIDDNRCVKCSKSSKDGVILQVHHKRYLKGKLPWEYDYSDCETMCKGCHAMEHGKIMPNDGWELVGADDLGALDGHCEACGTEIRYIFAIQHAVWPPMGVGTDCCDRLTSTDEAGNFMRVSEKLSLKKKRFLSSSRWKPQNSALEIKQDGITASITAVDNQFRIRIDEFEGVNTYESLLDAKFYIFEFIHSGKAKEFLLKKRAQRSSELLHDAALRKQRRLAKHAKL